MRMTWRWFGDADSVKLGQIAQIPVVKGIVGTIEDIPVGAVWSVERIAALKAEVEAAGFTLDVIESIPVSEAIKRGLPERDALIDAYCESIRNMGRAGVKVLCYNFMPLFDWMRTEMIYYLPDQSVVTKYVHAEIDGYLERGLETRVAWARGFSKEELNAALSDYAEIDDAALFEHLVYFLHRVIPAAEEAGVFLAIHPDDPPWSIFGLPRIVRDAESIGRLLAAVDSPHNGLTFCTGSLGTLASNDLPAMVKQFADADQLRPPAQRPAHRRSRLLRGRPSVGVRQRRSASGDASAGRDRLRGSAAPGSRATDLGRGRAAHRLRAVRPGARRNVLTRFVGGAASGRLTALAA